MSVDGKVQFTDQTMNAMISDVRRNLDSTQRSVLNKLRDGICDIVKTCDTNIKVVLYIDDILDEPIETTVGKGQNRLRITVQSDGKVTTTWTSETWKKIFKDVRNQVIALVKQIVAGIRDCIAAGLAIIPGAIKLAAIAI